jgi:hypothetical protein
MKQKKKKKKKKKKFEKLDIGQKKKAQKNFSPLLFYLWLLSSYDVFVIHIQI